MDLQTPLIDAAVAASKKTYLVTRYPQAKQILEQGLAANHIWNTDFTTAKDAVSSALETAIRGPYENYLSVNRAAMQAQSTQIPEYWVVSPSVQLNHISGVIKKLKKFMSNNEVAAYVAVLEEGLKLANAIQQLKPVIEKGRKPNPDAKPADFSNTATCAICQHRQKLSSKKRLVHHGFQISLGGGQYLGYRNGSCFGVDCDPYEVSCEANKAWIKVVERWKSQSEQRLSDLKSGVITEISNMVKKRIPGTYRSETVSVTYKAGDKEWSAVLDSEIRDVEFQIKGHEMEIERQQELIAGWKLQPLP
jgi:hypothetical protein